MLLTFHYIFRVFVPVRYRFMRVKVQTLCVISKILDNYFYMPLSGGGWLSPCGVIRMVGKGSLQLLVIQAGATNSKWQATRMITRITSNFSRFVIV